MDCQTRQQEKIENNSTTSSSPILAKILEFHLMQRFVPWVTSNKQGDKRLESCYQYIRNDVEFPMTYQTSRIINHLYKKNIHPDIFADFEYALKKYWKLYPQKITLKVRKRMKSI